MERLYPEKLMSFDLPARDQVNVGKLEGGHLSSDNSSPATATSDLIAVRVKQEATAIFACNTADRITRGLPPLPSNDFIVYLKRCWHHLRCTWTENMRKATDKWMAKRFEAKVTHIIEEFGDNPFSLDIINYIRLCEKSFVQKVTTIRATNLIFGHG